MCAFRTSGHAFVFFILSSGAVWLSFSVKKYTNCFDQKSVCHVFSLFPGIRSGLCKKVGTRHFLFLFVGLVSVNIFDANDQDGKEPNVEEVCDC